MDPISLVALILTAVGTTAGIVQSRKAEKAQEDADKMAQAQAELANQRRIRQAIAQQRQAQALILNQAFAQGAQGGSAVQGGLGAAQTQLGSNVGFAYSEMAAGRSFNRLTRQANAAKSRAGTYTAIGALPSAFGYDPEAASRTLFNNYGGGRGGNFNNWTAQAVVAGGG